MLINSLVYSFAKESLVFVSPFLFLSVRYIVSSLVMMAVGGRILVDRDTLVLALLTSTSSALWSYGLLYVTPAESAVLSYSMPLFSLPIAYLILRERPTRLETVGLLVGVIGVGVYSIPLLHGFTGIGALLTLVNAIFWASFTVYYRKMKDRDPRDVNASQFLIGGLLFTALSPLGFHFQPGWGLLEGLSYTTFLGGALSFYLWNSMTRYEKIARVTVMVFTVPLMATVVQVVETRTGIGLTSILGITLMFLGILISRLRGGIGVLDRTSNSVRRGTGEGVRERKLYHT